jgi:hypothetical protein
VANGLKAEAFERGGEQARMLETIAAAASLHQFLLQAVEIKPHAAAEQDVEVLERNMCHMRFENPSERRIVRRRRSAPIHPRKISLQIESVPHRLLPSRAR